MLLSRSFALSRLLPIGLLLVAMACIQGGASLATVLFPAVGPAAATSLRLMMAAALLWVVFRPWRWRVARRDWGNLATYGIALGTMNFLLYQAIDHIPLGIAVALEFTGPLGVALWSSKSRLDLLWVAIAVIGLGILLSLNHDNDASTIDLYGVVCALGAGGCWAAYILFGQKAGAVNGMQSAVWDITIAAIVIAPIGLVDIAIEAVDTRLLAIALGVAILATALPYTLEMIALPRLPTQTFGTLMSLEPAFGALSGLLFLGQALGLLQWLAIGAIIIASVGTTLTAGRKETVNTPYPD
ncbi:EamA family transporter [Salinisphaera sp.]|uniref:EamA family transporter n=1 Tax=Salinisphaera sp. TaxID=1914330 RepID=UPI000C59088A|nr:EamA family transporter [Salinisphaera sp.]MBS61489.1 EamA family transporter [Salinisphaera sp.]